jgi:transcriptional regulator with XRE-family HTH domain
MDIETYRQMLDRATANMQDGSLFQAAVREALALKLFENERELGQKFGVSRSQVNRWKNGRSLPGQGSRKTVYRVLKNQATRQMKSTGNSTHPRSVLESAGV